MVCHSDNQVDVCISYYWCRRRWQQSTRLCWCQTHFRRRFLSRCCGWHWAVMRLHAVLYRRYCIRYLIAMATSTSWKPSGICRRKCIHAYMSMSSSSRVRVIVNTEFACIPIAAIHNNMGFVRVRVTMKYDQFLCTVPLWGWKQQK